MQKLISVLVGALIAVALLGCTRQELKRWQEWHAVDPEAAMTFAELPEVQTRLQEATQEAEAAPPAPSADYGKWAPILRCESNGNWHIETGNGYSGGLQFAHSTWNAFGGREYAPRASQASPEQQIAIAEKVLDSQGWRAWPTCSRKAGYR